MGRVVLQILNGKSVFKKKTKNKKVTSIECQIDITIKLMELKIRLFRQFKHQ